jgi:hypothetical protein
MSRIFNVQLTTEELKALSVFKPELKVILDNYYDSYDIYQDRLGKLLGFIGYLSEHNYEEHLSKLEVLKNLIYDYFCDNEVKNFISEFELTDNSTYCKFISKIDSIYSLCVDLLDEQDCTEKEIKDFFEEYHKDLTDLIKH